jgi:hypothetical protein
MPDHPVVRPASRIVAILAIAAACVGCSDGPAAMSPGGGGSTAPLGYCSDTTDTVVISGGVPTPSCVIVPPGGSVLFVNEDSMSYVFWANQWGLTSSVVHALDFAVEAHGSTRTAPLFATTSFFRFDTRDCDVGVHVE